MDENNNRQTYLLLRETPFDITFSQDDFDSLRSVMHNWLFIDELPATLCKNVFGWRETGPK